MYFFIFWNIFFLGGGGYCCSFDFILKYMGKYIFLTYDKSFKKNSTYFKISIGWNMYTSNLGHFVQGEATFKKKYLFHNQYHYNRCTRMWKIHSDIGNNNNNSWLLIWL